MNDDMAAEPTNDDRPPSPTTNDGTDKPPNDGRGGGPMSGDAGQGREPIGDDEYRGEVVVLAGDVAVTVAGHLSARFEPVEGRYRWAGRAAPDQILTDRLRAGERAVTVRIGAREAPAHLGAPDPWGRVRLSGTGPPPWRAAGAG